MYYHQGNNAVVFTDLPVVMVCSTLEKPYRDWRLRSKNTRSHIGKG